MNTYMVELGFFSYDWSYQSSWKLIRCLGRKDEGASDGTLVIEKSFVVFTFPMDDDIYLVQQNLPKKYNS